ncbi:hypothetical protein EH221_00560 [bacterium]|nr:MAG: hypothetical protein EH221_00560 [bacterium]
MNSRERTFLALNHQPGDRIPIDFWATSAVVQNIKDKLGLTYDEFLDQYDVDLRYIEGPTYIGPSLMDGIDIWGVTRGVVSVASDGKSESYSEVTRPPLEDAESSDDVESYNHWPSPDMFDYSVIEKQCDTILKKNRVVVFMGDRLNRIAQLKPAMYLRGIENIFVDLVINPEIAVTIFRKIKEFYIDYLERILIASKGKIDIVLTGDDFGAQNGLLISVDMWKKFIKPGFNDYINLIKCYKTVAMHHTCGSVVELIPEMIDSGLDVLQSIQPEARGMALSCLKEKFGKNICFQGGISIQKTMPYGSPDDVRHDVKTIADTVRSEGGYIFCTSHNLQSDTPIENIVALMKAYPEFGKNMHFLT